MDSCKINFFSTKLNNTVRYLVESMPSPLVYLVSRNLTFFSLAMVLHTLVPALRRQRQDLRVWSQCGLESEFQDSQCSAFISGSQQVQPLFRSRHRWSRNLVYLVMTWPSPVSPREHLCRATVAWLGAWLGDSEWWSTKWLCLVTLHGGVLGGCKDSSWCKWATPAASQGWGCI